MKSSKLFGLCIIFFIAIAAAHAQENATMLRQLLNSYGTSYNDGSFNVSFYDLGYTAAQDLISKKEAGRHQMNFTVTGSGTGSPYTVVATLNVIDYNNMFLGGNVIKEKNKTGSGIVTFDFDGTYYFCNGIGAVNENYATLDMDIKVYQSNMLKYQNKFAQEVLCSSAPLLFNSDLATLVGKDNNSNSKYDFINLTLDLRIRENRTYRIGAYIGDNKTATAYVEKVITTTTLNQLNKKVSLIYPGTLLKQFKLTNQKIHVKSIVVDGQVLDQPAYVFSFNEFYNTNLFSTANIDTTEIVITNYAFNTSSIANGRLKQLGIALTAAQTSGVYRIELSLENKFGEVIALVNKTVSSWPTTLWINGTQLYNSKVNGPYRIGFIRITKAGTELTYDLDTKTSGELTFTNFTAPPRPDLKLNDSDMVGDGSDVNVTIRNTGTGDAAGITLTLFDNSANTIKEVIIDRLAAGSSLLYIFQNVNLSSGFAAVDFANLIEETNETNNIASFSVGPPNMPPVLNAIGNKIVFENQTLTFIISATDPENNTLTYSASGLPSGAIFTPATRTFTWKPSFAQSGNYTVRFNVTDGTTIDFEIINIEVKNVVVANTPSTITSTPGTTATRGLLYSYTMTATDPNAGDTLTYGINDTKFAKAGNVFTWTPSDTDFGTRTVVFNVFDGVNNVTQPVTLSLTEDIYALHAATLDFNQRDANQYTYIDSQVTINAQTKNTIGSNITSFNVTSNTVHAIQHAATGYQTDSDDIYLDARLPSCAPGQDCTLSGTRTTICQWQSAKNNWYCSVEGSGLVKKTWFRYQRTPQQAIKRVNYLVLP
jgi:hypothetical protein